MFIWHGALNSDKMPLMKAVILSVCFALPAQAQLHSGHYQTLPGTTVTEYGERVPHGSRVVPFSATLTLDLAPAQRSLYAVIPNAVLEGGAPFALTVHSSAGSQLPDGSYRFGGDYLRDLYPNGTQYLFDWRFSARTNGEVVWNGTTYWAGGHIWYVTLTNLTLAPAPWLDIGRADPAGIQIMWATNFGDYILESADGLAAPNWNVVTNAVTNTGHHFSVTLDTSAANSFYRLRRP
jgi:hypothetical protein